MGVNKKMEGRTHVMIGVGAGLTFASNYPMDTGILLVTAAVLGAIFPDIDHPKSKVNQKLLLMNNRIFKTFGYILVGIVFFHFGIQSNSKILKLSALGLILTGFSQHRGFTHSLLGLLIYSTVVKLISAKYGIMEVYYGFTIGYISHIVADFFTRGGIHIFYPVGKNIASPSTIKTGSFEEKFIEKSVGIYTLYLLLRYIGV